MARISKGIGTMMSITDKETATMLRSQHMASVFAARADQVIRRGGSVKQGIGDYDIELNVSLDRYNALVTVVRYNDRTVVFSGAAADLEGARELVSDGIKACLS